MKKLLAILAVAALALPVFAQEAPCPGETMAKPMPMPGKSKEPMHMVKKSHKKAHHAKHHAKSHKKSAKPAKKAEKAEKAADAPKADKK